MLRANGHRLYYGLLVFSMLLVFFAGWVSVHLALETRRTVAAAQRSHHLTDRVNDVMVAYGATESFGLRWTMTFDPSIWKRFQDAMQALDAEAAALLEAAADDPAQHRRALALQASVKQRHDHGRKAWPELRRQGVAASLALMRSGIGLAFGDRIRGEAEAMAAHETVLRGALEQRLNERLGRAIAMIVASSGLAIVAGLVGVFATGQARRSSQREREADHQRDKAETASEQKSLFLATMSHEIRTPMNAIFGFSQLLGLRVQDPKSMEYVRAIRSSGQSLLALINDLLDLSKIEAGRLELHRVPTDLRDLVDSTLAVFAEPAASKGIRLTADIDPFLPRAVVVDPHRLRQVLMNLVSNAVKYTDRGMVKVHVRIGPRAGPCAALQLAVEDSGFGIPDVEQERIFEPFHRVMSAKGEHVEGTGLGLAIVRRLVHLMDGWVALDSAVGRGSVFTIHLPAVDVAPEASLPSPLRPVAADFARLAPSRILVVDDVPLNRDLMAAYLADAGHALGFAENGREALAMFASFKPHVVLMDIRMPLLDGRAAAERIRELDDGRRVCLVAVTASSTGSDDRDSRRVFDAYLRKPVSPQDLYACLLDLVGARTNPEACAGALLDAGAGAGEGEGEGRPEPVPTPEQRQRVETALQALERLVRVRLPAVQSSMRLREVTLLANDLAELARPAGLERIARFAARLLAAVEGFDMTTIDSLLDQLPRHVAAERDGREGP